MRIRRNLNLIGSIQKKILLTHKHSDATNISSIPNSRPPPGNPRDLAASAPSAATTFGDRIGRQQGGRGSTVMWGMWRVVFTDITYITYVLYIPDRALCKDRFGHVTHHSITWYPFTQCEELLVLVVVLVCTYSYTTVTRNYDVIGRQNYSPAETTSRDWNVALNCPFQQRS